MEIKSSLKNIWVGMFKSGSGQSGLRTLKLPHLNKELME